MHGRLHSMAGAAAPGLEVEQGMCRRLVPCQQALDADLYMAVTRLADAWGSVHDMKHAEYSATALAGISKNPAHKHFGGFGGCHSSQALSQKATLADRRSRKCVLPRQ